MENQILNEEFLKMQKLAGLLNEEDDYFSPKEKFKFKGGKVKLYKNGNIIISAKSDYGGSGDEVEFTRQEAKDLLEVLKQILG